MDSSAETSTPESSSDLGTGALVARALGSATELVRVELTLARRELGDQLDRSVLALGIVTAAIGLVLLAVAALVASALLLLGVPGVATLFVTGLVLLGLAASLWLGARKILPRGLLSRTRARVASEIQSIEEHAP
ncbi:MAG TPA: phage holin family protein [Polyangiaceae bacterium]|nr:phage holin family protein [Polyangiaceae bacterium]